MNTEIQEIQLKHLSKNLTNPHFLDGFRFGLTLDKNDCQWSGTHTPFQETQEERELHDKMILISQNDQATKEQRAEMEQIRKDLHQRPRFQWAAGFHFGWKTRDLYHQENPLA